MRSCIKSRIVPGDLEWRGFLALSGVTILSATGRLAGVGASPANVTALPGALEAAALTGDAACTMRSGASRLKSKIRLFVQKIITIVQLT